MKKTLFAVVIVSIFTITSIALAENSPSMGSFGEMWAAIDDLRNEVATLRSDVKASANQASSEKVIVADDFQKVVQKKVSNANGKDENISRSEHFVMKGLTIQ